MAYWLLKTEPGDYSFGDVTLNMLKNDPFFSELLLVKFSRLSVMPVEEKYWIRIVELDG